MATFNVAIFCMHEGGAGSFCTWLRLAAPVAMINNAKSNLHSALTHFALSSEGRSRVRIASRLGTCYFVPAPFAIASIQIIPRMPDMSTNRFCIALLCGTLAVAGGAAYAQPRVPVRGTIIALEGNMLSVKTIEGRDMRIELDKDARVTYIKGGIKLADIKPGTGLGTTAVEGSDGKLVAREVHVFPPERADINEGHRPMAEPKTTMTNATVSAVVQVINGGELTLDYKGGSKVVLVPENTPVVMMIPGDRSYLTPGEYVRLTAGMNNDGKLTASSILVSKDGVRLPQ